MYVHSKVEGYILKFRETTQASKLVLLLDFFFNIASVEFIFCAVKAITSIMLLPIHLDGNILRIHDSHTSQRSPAV